MNGLLSWGGCALLFVGLKLIGEKRLAGFYVAFIAEAAWIAWGLLTGAYALVAMSTAIMAMYVRAIWHWKAVETAAIPRVPSDDEMREAVVQECMRRGAPMAAFRNEDGTVEFREIG